MIREGWIDRRQARCWRFGSVMFDEASWMLTVDGRRVAIEAKPLEILHELLLRPGQVVSKSELLDAVWPGISVVEASLPTAVTKLRRALDDTDRDSQMIETVPRIGYRLAIPVEIRATRPLDDPSADDVGTGDADRPSVARKQPMHRKLLVAAGIALIFFAGGIATVRGVFALPPAAPPPFTQVEILDALHRMDAKRIRDLLARGWDPNAPIAKTGDVPINAVLDRCEWNPHHDRQEMMFVVRMLLDAGARLDVHNVFGDTPYSIAKAPRYCGPNHPVTQMLHALCYSGPGNRLRDKCLATYELATSGRSVSAR